MRSVEKVNETLELSGESGELRSKWMKRVKQAKDIMTRTYPEAYTVQLTGNAPECVDRTRQETMYFQLPRSHEAKHDKKIESDSELTRSIDIYLNHKILNPDYPPCFHILVFW